MKPFRASIVMGAIVVGSIGSSSQTHAQTCGSTMVAQGGVIDAFARLRVVYWGWGSVPAAKKTEVRNILSNAAGSSFGLGGTRWWNIASQYPAADRYFGGTFYSTNPIGAMTDEWNDSHNVPGGAMMEQDVSDEVEYLADNFIHPGVDDIIMMMLPPGNTRPTSPPTIPPNIPGCGRHLASLTTTKRYLDAWISYPDTTSGCGDTIFQTAMSHETLEATMSPNWSYSTRGWDLGGPLCEFGDVCNGTFNQFIVQPQPFSTSAPGYTSVQQYWSNEVGNCAYSRSTNAYLFGLGTDNKLWASTVLATTSITAYAWYSWGSPTGVTFVGKPGVVSWGPKRIDAFTLGSTSHFYHAWSDDGGSTIGWETDPGGGVPLYWSSSTSLSPPDAVSWGAANVQAFTVFTSNIGLDPQVFSKNYDPATGWTPWQGYSNLPGSYPASKVTVASAGAQSAKGGGFPLIVHNIMAAFIDQNNKIVVGFSQAGSDFTWAPPYAPPNFTPSASGDLDISVWSPDRFDIFLKDSSGNYWDCASIDGKYILGCSPWGHPTAGAFSSGAGVVGMGDGRLLLAGRVGTGTGSAGYVSLWNNSAGATAWTNVGGNFNSGIDVASW